MKLRLLLLFVLLIPALWLAACATSPGAPSSEAPSVDVTCDDFNGQPNISKQLTVAVDNTFTVTLCSNPTTGFQWSEAAQISNTSVVEQVSHEFVSTENTGKVGAPGTEVWTFKVLQAGNSTIHMEYSRPWEGGEKGTWTFDLNVTAN